jgi:hypothetical protein
MKSGQTGSELVGVARLFWIMIGPAILLLLLLSLANRGGWFTVQDAAVFVVLAAVMTARWYEFRNGNPTTGTGDPATPTVLRNYLIGALLVGLGSWVAANLLGDFRSAP